MTLISDIEQDVMLGLEESGAGTFWNLQYEIRPLIVEAMNEACLISGEPQSRSTVAYDVILNQTLQAMPSESFCIVKIEGVGGLPISKTSVWDLDRDNSSWENDTDVTLNAPGVIKYWFPVGLKQFGTYPKLTNPAKIIITSVLIPISGSPPYQGTEKILFLDQYVDAFAKYALHVATLKEGGVEFDQSQIGYQMFLSDMAGLSQLGDRKNSIRWTRTAGMRAQITDIEVR